MLFFNKRLLGPALMLWAVGGWGQDQALLLADRYMKAENYEDAVTEFKRYIFFNSGREGADVSYAYCQIGLALGNVGKWTEAFDNLNKSVQSALDDKTKDERRLSLAVAQIGGKNYGRAKFTLLKLEMFGSDEDLRARARFFSGICAIYEYDWKEAQAVFEEYFQSGSGDQFRSIKPGLDALLVQAVRSSQKSPSVAKWLSTFLPGTGQIYCGDWSNGFNALALNAATGYLLVHDVLARQYQDVLLNSFFLFNRFYQGNKDNAATLALQYNERINRLWAEKILDVLKER